MSRTVQGMAIVSIIAWASAAVALGLGDIDVRSRLNQPFSARIAINAAPEDNIDDLKISIASQEEYKRAGVDQVPYLSTLDFAVKRDGQPYIQVSSNQPAREPFMLMLLDVRDGGNKIVREYSLFLDPAEYVPPKSADSDFYETSVEAPVAAAAPVVPAPVEKPAVPKATASPAEPTPAPAPAEETAYKAPTASESEAKDVAEKPKKADAPVPAAAGPLASASSYGPIGAGETLWSIATRARPQGASMDQVLLAIYNGNPSAFDGGINGLRQGATLQLPDASAVMAVAAEAAREEVRRLRGLPAQGRNRGAAEVPGADNTVTTMSTAEPTAAPTIAPTSKPTQRPTAVPTLAPTPEPTVEPTAMPTEMPTAEATALATTDAALESPVVAAGSTTDIAATADPATPEPATAEPEPTPKATAASKPKRKKEESGLLETLLLPLVAGLFVLIGIGLLASRLLGRRKAENDGPAPFGSVPAVRKPAPKPLGEPVLKTATPRQKLEDLDRDLDRELERENVRAAEAAAIASASTAQFASPEPVSTQRVPALDVQTQQIHLQNLPLEQTASPLDDLGLADTAKGGNLDFDLTGQFESQTMQINLDTNDPLSEADFHLAYGLYDEAALLLKQAIANEPQRADLQTKLAETYFAAGKAGEFEATAKTLRPLLSSTDWQKIAIMGQQLAPGSALYAVDGAAAGGDDGAVDLDLGSTSEVAAKAGDTGSMGVGDTGNLGVRGGDTGNLGFKLESFDEPQISAPVVEKPDISEALEFDLGEFDLAAPEPSAQKPAAAGSKTDDADLLDFDLEIGEPAKAAIEALDDKKSDPDAGIAFDLSTSEVAPLTGRKVVPDTANFSATLSTATAETSLHADDVGLDNVDLGDLDGGFSAGGDDAGTKLDLARAYVDMGDSEMARSLLTEVMQQGNDAQKRDANALLQTLG